MHAACLTDVFPDLAITAECGVLLDDRPDSALDLMAAEMTAALAWPAHEPRP